MSALSVEGVIELAVSERGSNCICCPGAHVYGMGIDVPEYDFAWQYRKFPAQVNEAAHDFLGVLFREHHYALDGRRMRITFELLPEEQ